MWKLHLTEVKGLVLTVLLSIVMWTVFALVAQVFGLGAALLFVSVCIYWLAQ